ncbi:MAG: rhodanese-like domain-containing protein [Planctomycetota bacterium]|nr:rhodanese-like domain-containing protein [Planctomycetota bacterium]
MFVQQFFVRGIAHSSYLLGGGDTCAIVDPQRDVQIYIDAAEEMGMRITHILETHLHADFVSGHLDLEEETGARIFAPKSARCAFRHVGVSEGDRIRVEDMTISVVETPGHTPEHVSYVVTDEGRGKEPVAVFCGDTLFVGDVGRPDLFPGRAEELAEKLFHSLHAKLMKLPDFCEVYPAHGAGSLCGRALGAKRTSTIGYERRFNAALAISDRTTFIRSLTTNMPAAPDHFGRCSTINRKGPTLTHTLPGPAPLSPAQFGARLRRKGTVALDIRQYDAFGGQHVPGSYNIDSGGNFATFAGWVLPPGKDILLVSNTDEEAAEASQMLRRVGLDRVAGYLDGGTFAWAKEGLPTAHVPQLSTDEFHRLINGTRPVIVCDVRARGEFEARHIKGAINVPAPDLRTKYRALDRKKTIAVVCSTGHRSSLAASLLKQRGFEDVVNIAGGMTGYAAAGYAGECPMCAAPHMPAMSRMA